MPIKAKDIGKVLGLLLVLYTIFATPWYLPKDINFRIAGIPVWAFLVPFITLILGYIITFITYKLEVE